MSKPILYLLLLFVIFACSPSESTKNANAENINTADFENTEVPTQTVSNTQILEKDYYRFKGTINENLPIVLDLNQENGNYVGSYYYTKHKMILRFDGKKNENGEIVLQVYDKLGNLVEYITGRINQNTFIGKWQNADRTKTFPISLTETLDRSILFYVENLGGADVISIRQVPKDGNLALAQKNILEAQGFDFFTNSELEQYIKKQKVIIAEKEKNQSEEEVSYYHKDYTIEFNDFSIGVLYVFTQGYNVDRGLPFIYDYNIVIDGVTGKRIMIEDIFNEEDAKIMQEKISKKENSFGYYVSSFSFNKEGMSFNFDDFNPEASAVSGGEGENNKILFSWSEIKDLIKEDSPVRRIFEN